MAIFYLLTIFASLPILAYVLSQRTSYKGIVFATTVFVLIGCLILFVSKFAILGSVKKQALTNNISNQIYIDEKISVENLKQFDSLLNIEEKKFWSIELISKSIDLEKLNSAESLLGFSEKFFVSNSEKLIFYSLFTQLRDTKFPEYKNSSFQISSDSYFPCDVQEGLVKLFINNGPEIPIAEKQFSQINEIFVLNADSTIPGFDIASAYLNNETIEIDIMILCKRSKENYYINNLLVLDKNRVTNSYKISSNEWLKGS
tara:strand:+ start:312 stop:1088 length:777 start_codon:yes stop_codon:yes gene_type:complete